VQVCFAHEGQEYRVTKRFLHDQTSRLERQEQGRFVRFAEGENADQRLLGILRGEAPGRGTARPENLGLAQVLWVPQGRLALGELSGDVVAGIRSALDAQVAGPGSGPLEKRIEELYLQYYTASSGREKSGKHAPPAVHLRQQIGEQEATRREALAAWQAFEQASRDVEDLRESRRRWQHTAVELEEALRGARTTEAEWRQAVAARGTAAAKAESSRLAYDELHRRVEAIRQAEADHGTARVEVDRLNEERPAREQALAEAACGEERARAAVEEIRREQDALQAAQLEVDAAARHRQLGVEIDGCTRRLDEIIAAEATLQVRRQERAGHVAPDAATLKTLRKEFNTRASLRARLEAVLITLEVVPERDGALTVLAGEPAGEQPLVPGQALRVKGVPEVSVRLEGFGRIRAQGPVGDAEEIRRDLAACERRLAHLLEGFGTDDPEALEALGERAAVLDRQVQEAQTRLETLLGDDEIDELRAELQRRLAARGKIEAAHPAWADAPPDDEALREGLERMRAAIRSRLGDAELAATTAAKVLQTAREALLLHESRRQGAEKGLAEVSTRLEQLRQDGLTPEELGRKLDDLALACRAEEALLRQAEERLAAFDEDPAATVEVLEAQLKAARADAEDALGRLKAREVQLVTFGEGSYSKLCESEERLSALREKLQAEELRMQAIKLLYDTVQECRSRVVAAVAAPVEQAATHMLRRIAGPKLGSIAISEGFTPARLRPELLDEPVGVDQASGGEQEQIHIATRLALAEVLARGLVEGDRQLVVLDDVLVATDTGRLARVLRILDETAERLQVLVLTCHPERYRGLDRARFLDLVELRGESG